MIENELETLKKTENECKEIVGQAVREKQEILLTARREAQARREAILRAAHESGEKLVEDTANRIKTRRNENVKSLGQQKQRIKETAMPRLERAASEIIEGMWNNGDCADERL